MNHSIATLHCRDHLAEIGPGRRRRRRGRAAQDDRHRTVRVLRPCERGLRGDPDRRAPVLRLLHAA